MGPRAVEGMLTPAGSPIAKQGLTSAGVSMAPGARVTEMFEICQRSVDRAGGGEPGGGLGGLVGGSGLGGLVATEQGSRHQVGCGFLGGVVVKQVQQAFDPCDAFPQDVAGVQAETGVEASCGCGIAIQDQVHGTTVVVVKAHTHYIPERFAVRRHHRCRAWPKYSPSGFLSGASSWGKSGSSP